MPKVLAINDYVLLEPAAEAKVLEHPGESGVTRYRVLSAGMYAVVGNATEENELVFTDDIVHMLPSSLNFFYHEGKKVLVGRIGDVLAIEDVVEEDPCLSCCHNKHDAFKETVTE